MFAVSRFVHGFRIKRASLSISKMMHSFTIKLIREQRLQENPAGDTKVVVFYFLLFRASKMHMLLMCLGGNIGP